MLIGHSWQPGHWTNPWACIWGQINTLALHAVPLAAANITQQRQPGWANGRSISLDVYCSNRLSSVRFGTKRKRTIERDSKNNNSEIVFGFPFQFQFNCRSKRSKLTKNENFNKKIAKSNVYVYYYFKVCFQSDFENDTL